MGDVHIKKEISEIPSTSHQVRRFSSNGYLLEVHSHQTKHLAHGDAVKNTSLLIDTLGFHSLMDDIFTRFLTLTSYISRRFIQFIEDLVFRDAIRCSENLVVISSERNPGCSCYSICTSITEGCSSSSKPCISISSPTVLEGRTSGLREELIVNARSEVVESNYNYRGVPIFFQGFNHVYLSHSLTNLIKSEILTISVDVCTTLRGSSDDIGWLQCTPGMASVVDGTSRFLELLAGIRNGEHKLPNSFVYLLIPGLFSNHCPSYFVGAKKFFSKMGLACHIAKIHSEASVEHNAWELKQYIEELYWGSGKRVMLLGHSKGGVDAAAALSVYWSDLKDKVAGLALVQSPFGGTPLASDILREGQIADKEIQKIMEFLICKLIKGDIRALEDLTYEKRKEFIMKHMLPENIPLISFHSEASIAPGVLATMTHIAHAELPWLPFPNFGNEESDNVQAGRQVPVVIPLSAAMAVCALHLQLRYGEKSDGLVTCRDAEVPGSVVVRPDKKLDHAWMVYSSRKKNPSEPDACEMCEALLTLLVELGKMKQEARENSKD
ncbi:hypothetical protein ACB092_01G194600 [Castanea dentata]